MEMTVAQDRIFQPYETRLNAKRAQEHVVINFRRIAKRFLDWCEEQGVAPEDVTEDQMSLYFSQMTAYAPTTVRHHYTYLRAAYRSAERRRVIEHNPTMDVPLPKIPDKDPRILSSSDLRQLRDNCKEQKILTLWHLLVYTGMRRVEIRRLEWEHVSFHTQQIRVDGKGGKIRLVPMHPDLAEHLAHLPQNAFGPVIAGRSGAHASDATINYWMDKMRDKTGIGAWPHDFRRTVASSLYSNGVDTMTIDKIMGWAPSAMRSRYINLSVGDQLHAAILRLYMQDPL